MTSRSGPVRAPSFRHEEAAKRRGFEKIAGVDEAGRGPLAGPVVSCAVVLPANGYPEGLNDSKSLSAARRRSGVERLNLGQDHCVRLRQSPGPAATDRDSRRTQHNILRPAAGWLGPADQKVKGERDGSGANAGRPVFVPTRRQSELRRDKRQDSLRGCSYTLRRAGHAG